MAEEYVKRINLSFDLRNDAARECYEKIISQPGNTKTLYVIKAISGDKTIINKEDIKECLKEVLKEYNVGINNKNQEAIVSTDIPDDIMNLINNI